MLLTGSIVLVLTAALVGMTTNPSDYTVVIVNCACAPLEKTFGVILTFVNAALDFFASPIFLFSRIITGLIDLFKDLCVRIVSLLLHVIQHCVRSVASALESLMYYAVDFTSKVVTYFGIFDGIITPFVSFSYKVRKWCKVAQMKFEYLFLDLIVQTYVKACMFYFVEICYSLLSFPFFVVNKGTEMALFILKYIIALPFQCFLELLKYVLYSLLHPYVCVVYSSCTVGIFVILVPVLMHMCRVRDIRPLIRWLCAVAMNTESRNRVLQILHRMASENGREITESEDIGGSVEQETETREECAVCYQTESLLKIVPCGHRTTCYKCLQEIEKINNRCPICREHILFVV